MLSLNTLQPLLPLALLLQLLLPQVRLLGLQQSRAHQQRHLRSIRSQHPLPPPHKRKMTLFLEYKPLPRLLT